MLLCWVEHKKTRIIFTLERKADVNSVHNSYYNVKKRKKKTRKRFLLDEK